MTYPLLKASKLQHIFCINFDIPGSMSGFRRICGFTPSMRLEHSLFEKEMNRTLFPYRTIMASGSGIQV